MSIVVLVIACANAANLLLARGMRRRREVGVQVALGVGRARLVRQVLTEMLLVASLACALGLLLSYWGGDAARSLMLPDLAWDENPINGRVLLFAMLAASVSVLLAGVFPAVSAARTDAASLLAHGGRSTYRRSTVRSGLVAVQAMLSLLLLVGAGLFVRSLERVTAVPLGFDPDRVVVFTWHQAGVDWDSEREFELYQRGLERLQQLPAVEAAALSMTTPMWSSMRAGISVPGLDSIPLPPGMFGPMISSVSPDYFRTVGARMLHGRAFTDRDVTGSPPVAVVTLELAELLWPGENALGKCFRHLRGRDSSCREVVGVVESTRYESLAAGPTLMFFVPIAQEPGFMRTLMVRPRGEVDASIRTIRDALQTLEPGLPHVRVTQLSTRVDPQLQPWRLGATLFSAFGALALLLAGFGLYGVVAYDVTQRKREFGVRTALGASASGLMRMVVRDAALVVAAGLGLDW